MKKAVTLIELIFTIVIIAAVFTTIPKIIYVSNKSLEFSKKEDAIFNMMSKIMDISLKEYDENNTEYDDILLTGSNNTLDCNSSSGYRVGGFAGSRNCLNEVDESNIPTNDSGEYDYIEGYNGVGEELSYGNTHYDLNISVGYTDEWDENNYTNDGNLTFKFSKNLYSTPHTNIKKITISVKKQNKDENISTISYNSANIGHMKINSVVW